MKNLNGDDGPEDEGGDQQKRTKKHGLARSFGTAWRRVFFPWRWFGCHDTMGLMLMF